MPLPDIPPSSATPSINLKPARDTDSFLLEEYKYLTTTLRQNEEAGERRITFLLTLFTATSAALVALLTSKDKSLPPTSIDLITSAALVALLLIGVLTLRRVVKRNAVSDEYKKGIDHIRRHFQESDGRLKDYDPFAINKEPADKKPFLNQRFLNGGLVSIASLLNSVLVATLCVLNFGSPRMPALTVGGIGFVASLLIQWGIVEKKKFAQLLKTQNDPKK